MLNSIENKMKLGLKIENHELITYMGTLTKRIEELNEKVNELQQRVKVSPIDELLLRTLEKNVSSSGVFTLFYKEDWIFRGRTT